MLVFTCPSGALSIEQGRKTMIKIEREDNGRKGRFVIYENDEFGGEMIYAWAGESSFIIDNTGVENNLIGRGLGKQLVLKAVEYARNNYLKTLHICTFARKVFSVQE